MLSSNTSAVSGDATYIEDVFSTYLYTGTGSSLPIVNNIDLATKGGLTWTKIRSGANDHILIDTVRGTSSGYIASNQNSAQTGSTYGITAFNADGYTIGNSGAAINQSPSTYASWTFRKQPKFFDIQTYTGSASAVTINHNLGSSPGCVIIKCTDTARNWMVWHRSLTNSQYMYLNTTDSVGALSNWISVSSTQITIQPNASGNPDANYVDRNYVAYIFAHDAGGFGLTGSDNVISCGTFTTDASSNASVTLGYEPQFVITKRTNSTGGWYVSDSMRGMPVGLSSNSVQANTASAESLGYEVNPTATGFKPTGEASSTYIYIAIRRGPMKVPTDATKVFSVDTDRNAAKPGFTSDFPVDFATRLYRLGGGNMRNGSRLTGANHLESNTTTAEASDTEMTWDYMAGWGNDIGATSSIVSHMFRRAPSFFDEVCYTGTGSSLVVNHNLGVAPELVIFKGRNTAGTYWGVYASALPNKYLYLNLTNAAASGFSYLSASSSTTMTLNGDSDTNQSGRTQVAYLFATCAGVSKVGSYTGTGTTKQVDCGFAAGARFVLIKRTDSTGDWYVWDTARGIVSGNDPYLLLNSTAAEVTSTDYIDTYSAGFELSSTAPAALNASGGTYIFLAIA